ncbi:threonine synthase [Alicyclobacillus tolerans]|uniref:Threonine synthase n=1 Tax=Alicyclobacillus tolerans TaxID=90970 RepID=A0A1M6LAV9_9BACL|nr:threonine synthase [Alicyclobacillus montanus]SHJ68303.1 L-threonine synthase [Alicyclobacillus montanus]
MSQGTFPHVFWPGLLQAYSEWLPINEKTPQLSLNEGNTPLIYSNQLSEYTGMQVYLKYEGANPTGSFKDRGMVLAVAKAKEAGADTVICASTGNTSASAAAYAARAGMKAVIVIPDKYVALGKLAQAMMYGARIVAIRGNFDEALEIVRHLADEAGMTVVNSVNPFRLEGQQTAAFEICDALQKAPDILCVPVGNAGNISAYWKGFKTYHDHQRIHHLPRMLGFEAEGAAAIVQGHPIPNPETFATAIRIGNPASAHLAVQASQESHGGIFAVSDEEIRIAYRLIAREGIFAEPGSAASVAGLLQQTKIGNLEKGQTVVCVLTGNGLKDPNTAIELTASKPIVVENNTQEVLKALKGESV